MRETKLFGKTIEKRDVTALENVEFFRLLGLDSNTLDSGRIGEIVFFICLKFLSESMGKLPILQYREDAVKGREKVRGFYLNNILNLEPNPYMTASTFWQCVELHRNYFGNSYSYIERYNTGKNAGKIKYLWILPTDQVTTWIDNAGLFGKENGLWYVWVDGKTGKKYSFAMDEILHFKSSISWDGVTGVAIKDIIKTQLQTGLYGQSFLSKLYKNNMFGSKVILQYTGDLNKEAKDDLVIDTQRYANKIGSGKFIPLPVGITATTLDMKLSDAEFTELSKLNALQIAACLGIKPNIINDYSKSSYSNSATQQTDFYVNSLLPIIKAYKEEITRKALTSKELENSECLEHDIRALFKLDPTAQAEMITKYLNNFGMTINEAREEIGYPYKEGADILIGNGNYVTLDIVKSGANYRVKGGESDVKRDSKRNRD